MCKGKLTKFVTLLKTVGQITIEQNYFGRITSPPVGSQNNFPLANSFAKGKMLGAMTTTHESVGRPWTKTDRNNENCNILIWHDSKN